MNNFNVSSAINTCKELRLKKIDVLKDKKAKSKVTFTIINDLSKEYAVVPFDDCVFKQINDATKKCDYGLELEKNIYFIELKGSDNNQALKQILKTYELTKNHYFNSNFFARIVTSHKQKPENLDKITYRKIIKFTKNNLVIEQNSHKEII